MTTAAAEQADAPLPAFFREMAERFLSRQSNVFLLSGNVTDKLDGLGSIATEPADPQRYCYLDQFLAQRLGSRGRHVVLYNIARGIDFPSPEHSEKLKALYTHFSEKGAVEDPRELQSRAARFDRSVAESRVYSLPTLKFLEELCLIARTHREAAGGISIIIKHAETLLPDAPLPQMPDVDRHKLTLITEWITNPEFLQSNEQVVLIAPTAASVHEALRRLPHVAAINVPLPDLAQRRAFIEWMHTQASDRLQLSHSQKELAELTAGMTLLTLQNLFLKAKHSGGALEEKDVLEALNRLLTSELGDKIEIVKPMHTMKDVIGATALKRELSRLKALLELRDPRVAPVGILVAGPNGVGKTYIFEAWAAECDRIVIILKNLRSMYFGQTDQIFEKLRNVLEALGNVIVLIDEADTMFGRPGANTHETESRLFGHLIRMMGDPKNRGRILWLLLTARPDNLAPDLKRSGRAGLHLPVFDPEGEDRRAYIDMVLQRAKVDTNTLTPELRREIEQRTADLSPADFNEVVVELRAERALTGTLTYEQILDVLKNIMPSQIATQRRIQALQALIECSRRSMIPPSLAKLTREEIHNELELLKERLR
jgi:SpoVK/Ycf46/Vps4 family AAA+-type ATPase